MTRENITINGNAIVTLRELLRPGLRAVVLGLNPAPKSVAAGHYWQGPHGQHLWRLLSEYGIVRGLRSGREDEDAFEQGIGFADVVRRPTANSDEISRAELAAAIDDTPQRLAVAGAAPIVCRYERVRKLVGGRLSAAGYEVLGFPSPYARAEDQRAMMEVLRRRLVVG